MKTLFYTTILSFAMMMSCRSVEKLVEQGQYDDAIYVATQKLAGKKNKKTKHIQALEEAFDKINIKDLSRIEYLKGKNDPALWAEIYDIALQIESRQSRIEPFLPLVSKDGYPAHFKLVDTDRIKLDAGSQAAAYHYDRATQLIEQAQTENNKLAAREAYNELRRISRYRRTYRDVEPLMATAHELGITHVLVKVENELFDPFLDEGTYGISMPDNMWYAYHDQHPEGITLDLVSTLTIETMDIGPEREAVDRFVERQTIERWVDQIDRRGNVVTDSLGNAIQVKEVETIQARIKEIKRTKEAIVTGFAELRNYHTGEVIDKEPINVNIEFYSDAYTWNGDRRALPDRVRRYIDRNLEPFPSDLDMVIDANQKILYVYEDFVKSISH